MDVKGSANHAEGQAWQMGRFIRGWQVDEVPTFGSRSWLRLAWNYFRHELLYLSWALMEITLLTPLVLVLTGWARYWPPSLVVTWLLLLMLFPFNLLRLMDALRISTGGQKWVMTVSLLLLLFASINLLLYQAQPMFAVGWVLAFFHNIAEKGNQLWLRDVGVFLLVVIMWGRGIALRYREFRINDAGLFLRVGGLLLAPLIIWLATRWLLWDIAPLLLLFFVAGLAAVSLIRAEEIERQKTGFSASLTPRWMGIVFLAILTVVFSSGLAAGLISGTAIHQILGWLAPVGAALVFGGTVVLATVAYVAFPLLELFTGLLQVIVLAIARLFRNVAPAGQTQPYFDQVVVTIEDLNTAMRQMGWGGKVAFLLIIVGIALVSIWTLGYLYQALRPAYRSQLRAIRPSPEATEDKSLGVRVRQRLRRLLHWRTAVSIRYVYQQMSQAAAASGYPRGAAETPYEYLKSLRRVWPANQVDSETITEAYVKIRYGEFPETETELEQIWQAWRRLQLIQPVTLQSKEQDSFQA